MRQGTGSIRDGVLSDERCGAFQVVVSACAAFGPPCVMYFVALPFSRAFAWRILTPRRLLFRVSCGQIAVLNRLDVAQAGEGVPVFHRMTLESLNVRLLK